jgi:D-3-phosphoglycerate dehydrogenase / 2-oxoglutarate reductase
VSLPTVVALGAVGADIVAPVLGPGIRFVEKPDAADLASASGAIVRAAAVVDRGLLESMPNLRVLARTGVGTDKVDLVAASERGIPVVVTPGANTVAVAEGTLAHILSLVKRLGPLTSVVRSGDWDARDDITVGDLRSKRCAIIGYGRIGAQVAGYLRALGMTLSIYDPVSPVSGDEHAASVDDALAGADVVTLHVPLTAETAHLLNRERIAALKPGAVVVNCSRGGLVDLDAVNEALNRGHIAGVGLDVFEEEPTPHHPLFDHPNVTLTPHVMGLTEHSTRETFVMAAQGIADFLNGDTPQAIANPEWNKETS